MDLRKLFFLNVLIGTSGIWLRLESTGPQLGGEVL